MDVNGVNFSSFDGDLNAASSDGGAGCEGILVVSASPFWSFGGYLSYL